MGQKELLFSLALLAAPILLLNETLWSMNNTDWPEKKYAIIAAIKENAKVFGDQFMESIISNLLETSNTQEQLLDAILSDQSLSEDHEEFDKFYAALRNPTNQALHKIFPLHWYRRQANGRPHPLIFISYFPLIQRRTMCAARSLTTDQKDAPFNETYQNPTTGKTFLHYAGRLSNWHMITLFLQKGVDPFLLDYKSSSVVHDIVISHQPDAFSLNKRTLISLFEQAEYLKKRTPNDDEKKKKKLLNFLSIFKKINPEIPLEIKFKILSYCKKDIPTYIHNNSALEKLLVHINQENYYFMASHIPLKTCKQLCSRLLLDNNYRTIFIPAYIEYRKRRGQALCAILNDDYQTAHDLCLSLRKQDLAPFCNPQSFDGIHGDNIERYVNNQ